MDIGDKNDIIAVIMSNSEFDDMSPGHQCVCGCCKDYIICPVTLPCGHNFCKFDLERLRQKICPECRGKYSIKEFKINLLLEKLVSDKIPKYDERKLRAQEESWISHIEKKYKKSERYRNYRRLIRDFLREDPKEYKQIRNHLSDITEDELKYILDIDKDLYPIDIANNTYIIYTSGEGVSLVRFIREHRTNLTIEQVFKMAEFGAEDDDDENLYEAYYGIVPRKDIFYKEAPIILLKKLADEDLSPYKMKHSAVPLPALFMGSDPDSDDDSGDDSGDDSDEDSSD